jgi:hypothetical protein
MDILETLAYRYVLLVLISHLPDARLAFQHVECALRHQFQRHPLLVRYVFLRESIQVDNASAETLKISEQHSMNAAIYHKL